MRERELRRRRTQPVYREQVSEPTAPAAPADELAPTYLFWEPSATPYTEEPNAKTPALEGSGDTLLEGSGVTVMTSTRPPIRPYRKPGARGMLAPRSGHQTERLLVQFIVCVVIFVAALVVKFAMPEAAQTVSGWVSEGISGQVDYKSAITAIGQSISGGAELSQVAQVISAELFGQRNADPIDPTLGDMQHETQPASVTPDSSTETETVAPTATLSDPLDEPAAAVSENQRQPVAAVSRADVTLDSPTTGAQVMLVDDLSLSLSAEDAYDDTEPLPFGYDKPETVSFANVTMTFDYSDPVDGVMTSAFGYRDHPVDGEYKFHYGLDLAAPNGTPIAAFADGVVEFAGESAGGYGKYVRLRHEGGVTTLYGHCDRLLVKSGQTIKRGETIAAVGQTGVATGDHLHFEVCADGALLNPAHYVGYRTA